MAVSNMSEPTDRRWESASRTHKGRVRKVNEDAVMARPDIGLWAVADGMGGYETGDVASQMIVQSLEEIGESERLSAFVNEVEDRLLEVNRRILQHSDLMLDGRTAGSTVVALLLNGIAGACLWAGDSRLYRVRNGRIKQISRDHSQVEEMIERGELLPEQAEAHSDSNVITRAVGAIPELHIEASIFSVGPGDTFLLCSDGLYRELGPAELEQALKSQDVGQIASGLIDAALEKGARDNVSVVVVRCT